MGTTPANAFPYPENSDLVTQGAAAIKALAERLEVVLAGKDAWHVVGAVGEPAFENGYVNASIGQYAGTTAGFRKDAAGTVHIRGAVVGPANGGTTAVFTLPLGYRPPEKVTWLNSHAGNTGPQICLMVASPDGTVVMSRISGSDPGAYGHYISGSFTRYGGA